MKNIAEINLTVLKDNALAVKNRLPENTKLCAVVKADAYGHGSVECANAIYKIADCFAVAIIEEGLGLRRGGIEKEILVFTPANEYDIDSAIRYNLTLTVCAEKDLKIIERECEKQKRVAKVHIKYNSGMNRNGVDGLKKLDKLLSFASTCKKVKVTGIYSHYACPEDDEIRSFATKKFLLAINKVKGYNKEVTAHISASGGFLKGQYFDMVRIGILLYGYKPFADPISVKPVMKIKAPVIKNIRLKKGESALYGNVISEKDRWISLVRYGYADGMPRTAVEGQFNNRCMDLTAIDKKLPIGTLYRVMDDADFWAKKYHTISYEILCGAAKRADRIYIR